ncbi:MAG TPA: PspC domain-containing protein [Alphaproteobacteria bacterium]|nr:PspC domain-containing protein [Alphaproteobacteria bacterium]
MIRKRLVKSRKKWLFGVASGLADYFGLPPIVVRAAFVIAPFFSILGLVAYFVLVVWMPKAPTTDC